MYLSFVGVHKLCWSASRKCTYDVTLWCRKRGAKTLQLDLTLLKPLWTLYRGGTSSATDDGDAPSVIPAATRALTDLFLEAEGLALVGDAQARACAATSLA